MPVFKLHQLADEMRRRARSGRAVGELPGIFLRFGDELLQSLPRRFAFDHRCVRAAGRQRERREILHGEAGILVNDRNQHDRRRRDENRVAVRRRVLGGLNAHRAAAARLC